MNYNNWYKDIEGVRTRLVLPLNVNGFDFYYPTREQLTAQGYYEWTPTPHPYEPTRSEKINAEIRAVYTENDEFMILRQYNAEPSNPEYAARFAEYNAFVEAILAKYPEE